MIAEPVAHKIIVSTSVLAARIAPLTGLIASKPILPILDHFLFDIDAGILTVTASDLQVFLSVEIPIEASETFSCCVPAKLLTALLGKLPEQPVTMHFSELLLTFSTDNGTYEIPTQEATDYPASTEATPGQLVSLPVDQLQHALYHTGFATSDDGLRPEMGCVCLESNLGLRFMSTDGHRAVCVERPDDGLDEFLALLPRKAAALLTKLLADTAGEVEIEIRLTTILFRLHGYLLEARQAEGTFPDVISAFRIANATHYVTVGKSDLASVLKRLLLFAEKTTALIRIDLEAVNQIRLSVDNEMMERRAVERLLCDYDGGELSIGFNGGLLLELIEHIENPMVTLLLESPDKSVFLTEQDTESNVTTQSLLMPTRLFDPS